MIAILSTNFGAGLIAQQEELVNAISDRSIFVVNDTLNRGTHVDYDDAFAISQDVISQIESISGVSKVYPWYSFTSDGWEPDSKNVANIKITDGSTIVVSQNYNNIFSGTGDIDKLFTINPLYTEESIGDFLDYKSDLDTSDGITLTMAFANQLYHNPAELIGKHMEITCFVPVKLYETAIIGGGERTPVSGTIHKLVTFECTITGVLSDSYTLRRSIASMEFVTGFINYDKFIDIINQNMDMNIGEAYPGFPEQALGPSALVVFANSYTNVSAVTSKVKAISSSFSVGNNIGNSPNIQENLSNAKSLLMIITIVFIAIIAIVFGILYYLKNRSRKKEFGILKAIGFTKPNIVMLTTAEMLRVAFPAFIVSIILSFALMNLVNWQLETSFLAITLSSILVGFAICIATAVLAGLLPVYNASKVDPVKAIRGTHK